MSTTEEIERIEEALKSLRPFLEKDNGDITFVELTDEKLVKVALHGECATCSMSTMTLKAGVEERIRSVVPGIKGVVAV